MFNSRLEDFQEIVDYNISDFLQKIELFFKKDYVDISNYYLGNYNKSLESNFRYYYELKDEFEIVFSKIESSLDRLSLFIDIISSIEDLYFNFKFVEFLPKWLKSSKTSFGYNSESFSEYFLGENTSLERVSLDIQKVNNFNSWFEIAFNSNLVEVDYNDNTSSKLLLKNRTNRIFSLNLNSFVDYFESPESIYGRDLKKSFSFKDNDLEVLSNKETLKQTVEILLSLYKRDNPNIPNVGFQKELQLGSVRSFFQIPIIKRQLQEIFSYDDSFKSVDTKGSEIIEDNAIINIEITTVLNEIIQYSLS